MPEIYNNAPHLMKTDLLNRGWTTTSINRYLPHPIVEYRRSHRGTYSVHLWPQSTIESAETSAEVKVYIDTIKKRRESASLTLEIPLLDATREASRSAHRWRDRAITPGTTAIAGTRVHAASTSATGMALRKGVSSRCTRQGS